MKTNITYINIILYILIILNFYHCTTDNKNNNSNQVKNNNTIPHLIQKYNVKFKRDSNYIKKFDVSYNVYTLTVELTFMNDSVVGSELHLFKPVILKQKLIFSVKGNLICEKEPRINKVSQKVISGKSIIMPDNQICEVNIIKGTNGYVYLIEGYCGANSCADYKSIYSMNGVELWSAYIYFDNKLGKKIRKNEYGNYVKVLNKIGISDISKNILCNKTFYPSDI